VRSNAERKVAHALTGRGLNVLLPLQKRPSRKKGQGVIEVPLFPGYLFVQLDPHALLPVLVCPGVVRVVCRGKTPEPVDPKEMQSLLTLVESDLPLSPLPAFAKGEKVVVNRGPLADLEAIILRDESRPRVIVSISLLQRSVVAEVDRTWLHAIDSSDWSQMEAIDSRSDFDAMAHSGTYRGLRRA